ncbi:HD-GYP domain-containing protein [Yinghuangia sp. ASG 101]|uniref:HD-GYP domain-containing protein n=1 Tax=Yinghuangia sp. ASG 101 TaxID=2896848 RepID=UPI002F909393
MGTLPVVAPGRSVIVDTCARNRGLRAGAGFAIQGAVVVSATLFYLRHLRRSLVRVRGEAARDATVLSLLRAVEVKDGYTRAHSERVAVASVLIARQLGLPKQRVVSLRYAALLHDVGKLGVPTRLLTKSGPLDADERETIQRHPQCGADLVRDLEFLGEGRDGILHHHERMDGRGYPSGLRGDAIPEFARIIAVADAFDAMTSTRSYRRSRPIEAALSELNRCRDDQFDGRMVAALQSALRRHGWPLAERPGPPPPGGHPCAHGLVPPVPVPRVSRQDLHSVARVTDEPAAGEAPEAG